MRGAEVVLVTGISGSGKSVALHALEDAGFFCVDNLPPELLRDFIHLEHERYGSRVAVAVDVRTAASLPLLVPLIDELKGEGVGVRSIFLDASTEALMRRFSETRRPHPLAASAPAGDQARVLKESIELERAMLTELREVSTVIDTSQLRPVQLRAWLRDLVHASPASLAVIFESFAFKYGVPSDADFVFDLRALPNPFYMRALREMDGREQPVADFLAAQPEVTEMLAQIETFLRHWLPSFRGDQRSYLTVALGCTGGQHRSVYAAETLRRRFAGAHTVLVRHRELDGRG